MRKRIASALILAVVVAVSVVLIRSSTDNQRDLTVLFPNTEGLYQGANVKVLGVNVGRVDSITVVGTQVAVKISYSSDVQLPSDVHAMIVPPSLVGDRYVQLTPAYISGPVLADHAHLGQDRSGVPLGLAETFQGLNTLASGLGPSGANRDGSLSRLVSTAAKALKNNGALFRETITQLAQALGTVSDSSGDVSATIANLSKTTATLAGNDTEVRQVVGALATIGTELNGQRSSITTAVTQLRSALSSLATFTEANRGTIHTTISRLTSVADQLSAHGNQLGNILSIAPVGLTNLMDAYVPTNSTLAQVAEINPAGRAGVLTLRAGLFENLDVMLGTALSSVCASLPTSARAQLAAVCTALQATGGNLGTILFNLTHASPTGMLDLSTGATTLSGLLSGSVR